MTYRQNLKYHIKSAKDLNLSLRPSYSISCSVLCRLLGRDKHPKLELTFSDYDSERSPRASRSWHSVIVASITLAIGLPILFWSFDSTSAFSEPQSAFELEDNTEQVAVKSLSLPPLPQSDTDSPLLMTDSLEDHIYFTLPTDEEEGWFEDEEGFDEDAFFDAQADQIVEPIEPDNPWETLVIQSGDSLSVLFERNDLSSKDLHNMLKAAEQHKAGMLKVMPGQKIKIKRSLDIARHVEELNMRLDFKHRLRIFTDGEGYTSELIKLKATTHTVAAHGSISGSLYASVRKAGLPRKLLKQMRSIARYDIDFKRLKRGDKFSVVYEKHTIEGQTRTGQILAVKITSDGHAFRAVRYTDKEGYTDYYTPEGNSLRKAFLRAPLKYTRISSRFNLHRRHPILRVIRAHRGVDFAAPKGTPVYSAGDGVIEFVGRKSGYGKTIVVKHNFGDYSTLYAHLSGFKEGLKKGQRVRQGHTIGFVGSTGLSTGNHLHYEFRIKGEHKDPLTVKLPKSTPLPIEYKKDFLSNTRDVVAKLEGRDPAIKQVAMSTATDKK